MVVQYKQVIVVRRDLNLPAGKAIGQGAHASVWAYQRAHKTCVGPWEQQGCTKIVLGVDSEDELLALADQLDAYGLDRYALVHDAGRTVLESGTLTCLGVGPILADTINAVTGHLKLY
jgi:PTH2 family peptidyl-tRNA hydrolase